MYEVNVNTWAKTAHARLGASHGQPHASSAKLRALLVHQNFPGQFLYLARYLYGRPDVEVIGLGRDTALGLRIGPVDFPWFKYSLHRDIHPGTHHYLRQMEAAVLHVQAAARALDAIRLRDFIPDVILAHSGWGETLYAKEIFSEISLREQALSDMQGNYDYGNGLRAYCELLGLKYLQANDSSDGVSSGTCKTGI